MGKTFKHIVLCSTNDFPASRNEKIRGWVEANGGKFTKTLTSDVTHLLTSIKAWKRYGDLVREARKKKTIHIVKYEWLEDSLLSAKKKPLPTEKYSFEQRKIKKMRKKIGTDSPAQAMRPKKAKRVKPNSAEFTRACVEFETDMGEVGFHPYTDQIGFVYIITLVRHDILKNKSERHQLRLYESDAQPHTYACYSQYSRQGIQKTAQPLAPVGSTWSFAWAIFEKFFRTRCGIDWKDRPRGGVVGIGNASTDGDDDDDDPEQGGVRYFEYETPEDGEPNGIREGESADNDCPERESRVEEAEDVEREVDKSDQNTRAIEEPRRLPVYRFVSVDIEPRRITD